MTQFAAPMCVTCTRFNEQTGGCDAYPDGIPREILEGAWDHRTPKAGDRGLQYDPKPGAPAQMPWWPEERPAP